MTDSSGVGPVTPSAPALRVSVIIPFKNEEATIPLVLGSLERQVAACSGCLRSAVMERWTSSWCTFPR